MSTAAALPVLVALVLAMMPQQKPAEPQPVAPVSIPCDSDGVIRCSFQEIETVTGSRTLQDVRTIARYIELVAERNRRHYIAWGTRLPSAAFELVRRVKSFPYLPYGDPYAIVGMDISIDPRSDRISVRYPKKPKQNTASPVAERDHAIYDTKLSSFIKSLETEIDRLKKYAKAPAFPF